MKIAYELFLSPQVSALVHLTLHDCLQLWLASRIGYKRGNQGDPNEWPSAATNNLQRLMMHLGNP